MDVSLAALRSRLFSLRSWDSTGETLNNRIRDALNLALDRLSGEVPEALVPDEQHIVLYPDVDGGDSSVAAKVATYSSDKRLLYFVDTAGLSIADSSSATTWRPTVTGEWDGTMHIEVTDASDQVHRRQCLEWFTKTDDNNEGAPTVHYIVSIDRPMPDITANSAALSFRIHQPEFFLLDDVMEVLEPARIYEASRQQVWKIDTGGASRQDMLDFQGNSKGRPYRCWRGRHFQIPSPTEAPTVQQVKRDPAATIDSKFHWLASNTLRSGTWSIRYTYVWGRRDEEWQQSPMVTPGGDTNQDSSYKLTWAYEAGSGLATGVNQYSGIHDPVWESAPSPATTIKQTVTEGQDGALVVSTTNIDEMLGFGGSTSLARYGRSGLRIRYYVAHVAKQGSGVGDFNAVETNLRYYLLCETEPTFDHVSTLSAAGTTIPTSVTTTARAITGARIVWNGRQLYDYYRPLKHSTGYYAWKVYPHQDARYELDFRVLRLPRKYIDDQDTAPIQRDAIPSLIELALYYVSLDDGNDQLSAAAHLSRYQELVRGFRQRYANTGGVVEPVPLTGYRARNRYGTFSSGE
mgnify:CR=1 FL=1